MEEEANEGRGGGENEAEGVAPALISVHPQEYSVAVAVGSELRVYNMRYEFYFLFFLVLIDSIGIRKLLFVYSRVPMPCRINI